MSANTPERQIEKKIIEFLEARGWLVEKMVGNAFQNGIPDLYCFHRERGARWLEVKRPDQYSFTPKQCRKWPIWEEAGIGIWILTAATQEQYDLLFGPPNWRTFWKASMAIPDVNAMIDDLALEYQQSQAADQAT